MRQVVEAVEQMDEECQARALRGLAVMAAMVAMYFLVSSYREYLRYNLGEQRALRSECAQLRADLVKLGDFSQLETRLSDLEKKLEPIAGQPAGGLEN